MALLRLLAVEVESVLNAISEKTYRLSGSLRDSTAEIREKGLSRGRSARFNSPRLCFWPGLRATEVPSLVPVDADNAEIAPFSS